MKSLKIEVFGKVQGVGFRYYTTKTARSLGLVGFVKNLPDGSVYIEVSGENSKIDNFIIWCKTGPDLARVDDIKISEIPHLKLKEFKSRL